MIEENEIEDGGEEIDRESEKEQRRRRLNRRKDEDSEFVEPKKKDRLKPYDKKARRFDWRAAAEDPDGVEE